MNAKQVASATTAELVAFFNANSAKPVNKFTDRKTAERRVLALIAEIEAKMAVVRPAAARSNIVAPKDPAAHAAAIARSWADPAVRAARITRHAVQVTGPRGKVQGFRSVREAFEQLSLPLGRHIAFRGQLKAAGAMAFEAYNFAIAAAA